MLFKKVDFLQGMELDKEEKANWKQRKAPKLRRTEAIEVIAQHFETVLFFLNKLLFIQNLYQWKKN